MASRFAWGGKQVCMGWQAGLHGVASRSAWVGNTMMLAGQAGLPGERTRLACWRLRLAIANFSYSLRPSKIAVHEVVEVGALEGILINAAASLLRADMRQSMSPLLHSFRVKCWLVRPVARTLIPRE